jgi:hypothetical protein
MIGWRQASEPPIQEEAARDRGDVFDLLLHLLCSLAADSANVFQRANILKGEHLSLKTFDSLTLDAEVQIMQGTHHPSIVKLYSFSESLEHYFLVLECTIFSLSP